MTDKERLAELEKRVKSLEEEVSYLKQFYRVKAIGRPIPKIEWETNPIIR